MQNEQSSIFNREFLLEIQIRRRRLMPLTLKIYVWFYLVISAFFLLSFAFLFFTSAEEVRFKQDAPERLIATLSGILLISLLFFSSFFILLEKKWSILFALFVTGFFMMVVSTAVIVRLYRSRFNFYDDLAIQVACILLTLPYFALLLKIRPDWTTKAVSGKQLKRAR